MKNLILLAALLTSACATATAAPTVNLCGKATDHALISEGNYDPPMWVMPDTGTYGEVEGNEWLNMAKLEQPVNMHCFFSKNDSDEKIVPLSDVTSCKRDGKGIVSCQ